MYKGYESVTAKSTSHSEISIEIHGDSVQVADASFIRDADFTRDGMDLVLHGPEGSARIEGYFAEAEPPVISAPDGTTLSPALVDSFLKSGSEYASLDGATDESPVGAVSEVSGEVTVTHLDGTSEIATLGAPIYEGDIIETAGAGAVNITFVDETQFAVSENARLAIDEYVFDPQTNEGSTDFSVLKGLFVFTSGLIGREDPDDVTIDTPMGSIGIRGTIIAGNVNSGEITVVEGAIVLRDFEGHQVELASQFETAKFNPVGGGIDHIGVLDATVVSENFSSVAKVSGGLFSSVNDAAKDAPADVQNAPETQPEQQNQTDGSEQHGEVLQTPQQPLPPLGLRPVMQSTNQAALKTVQDFSQGLHNQLAGVNFEFRGDPISQAQVDIGTTLIERDARWAETTQDPNLAPPPVLAPTGAAAIPTSINAAPDSFFTGTSNLTWSYDFSAQFPNLPANYKYSLVGYTGSTAANGAASQGTPLAISLTSETDGFDIILRHANGEVFDTIHFNIVNGNTVSTSGSHTIGTAGNITLYTGVTTPTIAGSSNTIFFDGSTNLTLAGNGNFVYLSDDATGNATVSATASGNNLFGGAVANTITFAVSSLSADGNKIYGLAGDDTFKINGSTALLMQKQSGTDTDANKITNTLISGGTDRDVLQFNVGPMQHTELDFSKMEALGNQIRGIEEIYTVGGSGNATVVLTLENIFKITDQDHKLYLNMDGTDIVKFDDSKGTMTQTGTTGGYDVYEGDYNGQHVTLYVDSDAAANVASVLP